MSLNTLVKITHKKKRRLGLGHGSGRSKTAGRGTKGQKARGRVRLGFEGGQLPFIRRLPFKRGFKSLRHKPLVLNVNHLNIFEDGTVVDEEKLVTAGLLPADWKYGVKVLGDGELKKKLVVKGISCSQGAKTKIEAAKGSVE